MRFWAELGITRRVSCTICGLLLLCMLALCRRVKLGRLNFWLFAAVFFRFRGQHGEPCRRSVTDSDDILLNNFKFSNGGAPSSVL
jgi:hypothetical protein